MQVKAKAKAWLVLMALVLTVYFPFNLVQAQQSNGTNGEIENITVSPIACWWRTSTSAVRVGEEFILVLTCSVLETETTTVIVDRSRLDPQVVQLPPFEVIGGTQATESQTISSRFFQYEYTLQYIGEDFDQELEIPPLIITYYVESRVNSNQALEARDQQYILPQQSLRIVSLVPSAAKDIRDYRPETLREIATRRLSANITRIAGLMFFVISAVLLIWTIRQIAGYRDKTKTSKQPLTDRAILQAALRELETTSRKKSIEGWNTELTGRALAILRIVAEYELSGSVLQTTIEPDTPSQKGQLRISQRLFGKKPITVSSPITAETVAQKRRTLEAQGDPRYVFLANLQAVLEQLTLATYGLEEQKLNTERLDDALADGIRITVNVIKKYTWFARKFRNLKHSVTMLRNQVWLR
jgi:hypothetical protein